MSEVVALVVWIIVALVVLALFVWWWRGVHAKSKERQAADILTARGGVAQRLSERRTDYQDGMNMPPPSGPDG